MAEQKVGRAAVLKAMAPVMTAATKYTHEALDIYDVRLALAGLISGQGGADAAALATGPGEGGRGPAKMRGLQAREGERSGE